MPIQSQLLAIEKTRKNTVGAAKTSFYHLAQRDLFTGLTREYKPLDDGGLQLPAERKYPQANAREVLTEFVAASVSLIDLVADKDNTNRKAVGDIVLPDGTPLRTGVPVSTLLMLEKEFNDWRAHLRSLPTLDPAHRYEWDEGLGMFRSEEPDKTIRNEQVPKVLVKYEATDKHAAQTEVYQAQVPVGEWTITKFSTQLQPAEVKAALARLELLIEAVKSAREAANKTEVENFKLGKVLFDYLLDGSTPQQTG